MQTVVILQGVHECTARAFEQDGGLALVETRHERLAVLAAAVFHELAVKRMAAGRAMRLGDEMQVLRHAPRTHVPQPTLLHRPAAMHAAARENRVERRASQTPPR